MIDRKFEFVAENPCNGKVYTEDDAFVFCAKDAAVPAALDAYIAKCKELGANPEHIESVKMLAHRVRDFQSDFGSRVPDTVGDEIGRCLEGIGIK